MENEFITTFNIKKEELDIAKEWMQTGEVNIYRDIITEKKSFIVPVKREELVIEKKVFNLDNPNHKDVPTKVIRILLNEEHIKFDKHLVNIEDVTIYKQQIDDIKHIEATLKREQPIVKISGSLEQKNNSK